MKKALLFLTITLIATMWFSCTKDTAPVTIIPTGNCDSTKVNYTKDIVPIVNATCLGAGCHSAGQAQVDFTSYAGVKGDIDNILCRIPFQASQRCGARMPQGLPPLSSADSLAFAKWKVDGFYDCH